MKNIDKLQRLQIQLEGSFLGTNLELQELVERLEKVIEEREYAIQDREQEIEDIGGRVEREVIETVIDEIRTIEWGIYKLTGLRAECLALDEVLNVNEKVQEYNRKYEMTKLAEDVAKEIESEDNDKRIFAYDVIFKEYRELTYDEEHYYLLSKLNIIEKDRQLLFMTDMYIYEDLLHFVFDKDYLCFITRKQGDFYDIRKENFEFTQLTEKDMQDAKDDVKRMKEDIDKIDVEKMQQGMKVVVEETAKETIDLLTEVEKILGCKIEDVKEKFGLGDENDNQSE
ncbi:MAG: hypothetical protein J6J36_00440 [Clostridia bacterium]|nr:hypothetical protein [Clostridia bacterium]